jgi:hypothetical protein
MRYPSWGRGDARKQGELKMERRKFLIGAGSAAVGASALIGSGAFTSVSADRSVDVDVVSDSDAFLTIEPEDTSRASENSNGTVEIDFVSGNDNDDDGTREDAGLNPNARTAFRDVLRVENRGTNDIYLSANDDDIDNLSGIDRMSVFFYNEADATPRNSNSGNPEAETRIDGSNSAVTQSGRPLVRRTDEEAKLEPGEAGLVSFFIVTGNEPQKDLASQDTGIEFRAASADRTKPGSPADSS